MKNHVLRKMSVFAVSAVMAIGGPSLSAFAEAESTEPEETVSAEDDTAKALELLEEIKGTYEPLFPIITDSQYDQLWLDSCIAVVGEEAAPQVAEMLKAACSGTVYGQEAIDAFGDGSEGAQFDCLFINGPSAITFDGNMISGIDENGDQLFSHEYKFVNSLSLAGLMQGYLYETEDEDAGEFKYFYMMPDTPATTYHLEFRYGSDVDALAEYNEGPYAYWLAAGFPVDADEEMIENVITLFCEENLAEMADEKTDDTAAGAVPESDGEEIIEIATAEELAAINENLSGHYVLTADIDLGGEEWTPIGTYAPSGESPEEQEIPSDEYAFTGSFDGQGHTISNLSVHQPEGWAIGLFGCISNTQIDNFTLENAQVEGTVMVSCVVGYAYNSE